MNSPSISIIIAVYNAERLLSRCIDSIQAQTFRDFEALFIDDCSTDASVAIIEDYAKSDPRIKLIRLRKNGGQGIARNIGIERACGEYLSFIDSDDAISANFLEKLYSKARETHADIVKGICVRVKETEQLCELKASDHTPEYFAARSKSNYKLFHSFNKEHWSALYRRAFLIAHSIRYGTGRCSQDTVFLLAAGYYAKEFVVVPDAKYYYFQLQDSTVHKLTISRFYENLRSTADKISFANAHDFAVNDFVFVIALSLQHNLAEHTYMSMHSEFAEEAPAFLKKIYDAAISVKFLPELIEHDYSLRVLVESAGSENISTKSAIVGLEDNYSWRLEAYKRFVDHLNSESADMDAGMKYLDQALVRLNYTKKSASTAEDGEDALFYKRLQRILLGLKDHEAFIKSSGIAAKALLDYGENLFFATSALNNLQHAKNRLDLVKRILDILEKHPDASKEYYEHAYVLANKLMSLIPVMSKHLPEEAARFSLELAEQIKQLNALKRI